MKTITVLSLGAGVQSSCLYLMSAAGELESMPVCAIFADTGDEPQGVYDYLEYLENTAGNVIPIHRVSQGHLGADVLATVTGDAKRCSNPPFYVINRDGSPEHTTPDRGGMLWRTCTTDYKLNPIRREARRIAKGHGAKRVNQWIGISLDEFQRMKPSRVKYITNVYPLINLRITRQDCLRWLRQHGHPQPTKSACVFCPYRSNSQWAEMRKRDPDSWRKAVEFDRDLRVGKRLPGVTGQAYVSRQLVPLEEAVLTMEDRGQLNLFEDINHFDNECEGMCGV